MGGRLAIVLAVVFAVTIAIAAAFFTARTFERAGDALQTRGAIK